MKKTIALTMLVLFWVANTSVASVHAPDPVWNVGPGQIFPTITAALMSGVVMPGDTIHVWNNPNPYVENPSVYIPNIKIIGQSLGGVRIQAAIPGDCFAILAPGVTIMELTIVDPIMAPGDVGVHILPPSMQCRIWNNVIRNFDYGIVIDNSANNEIIGNEVSGCMATPVAPPWCSTGILMLGPGATNNGVRGNEMGLTMLNWYAVGTNGASGNTITLNNFWASANVPQAFVMPGDMNTWDSGRAGLRKGNWWNDTMGWPPPYIIDPLNMDNFCSIAPYNWATMPWDLNRDGKCNIIDIATAAAGFGAVWSMPGWNPKADVTGDGKIDIKDIATIARWFGWTDP